MDLQPSAAKPPLATLDDCRLLVNTFYTRVRADELLEPVFTSRIADEHWPAHLERMASFWYTVLFGVPLFRGDPPGKHRDLPIAWAHFERWLALWAETVDELFVGEHAEQAKERSLRMAYVLSRVAGAHELPRPLDRC